jgi:crotonobetainyl-CoA:carnitine CoA-transferase CaiB-like acyl-CoA transferase
VVADFSRVLAGPYATMMLGDMGAEVIKVERPVVGDDTRGWGPPFDDEGQTTYFNSVNRNKTSVTIDMQSEAGRKKALDIAAHADIVIENFRAGTMAKFGLSYEDVKAVNPTVIYCSITGFGAKEGAALPGYDLLIQAMGGLMSLTGVRPTEPMKVGVALVDVLTGVHAAVGILAALNYRQKTGEGQLVELSLFGTLLSSMVNQASGYLGAGTIPGLMGNAHPSVVPYALFETGDRPLALAVGNDKQFALLADVINRPEWATDPRFQTNAGRVVNRDELNKLLVEALSVHGADFWFDELRKVGVPAGPINNMAEAFKLAEELGLDPIARVEGKPTTANPIIMSETPMTYRTAPPHLNDPE